MAELPIPPGYRSDVCRPILEAVRNGESCSLIGVGSSGKSNVARHLLREDARAYCLGPRAAGMAGVLADGLRYTEPSAAALHRWMLQALLDGAQTAAPGSPLAVAAPAIEAQWLAATAMDSADRAQFGLQRAVQAVLADSAAHLFFVLDDFDHVLETAPGEALNSLRGLRDNHKNVLTFVTVTRRELGFIRPEEEYEDFAELVTATTLPVGLYSSADVAFAADRLVARWDLGPRVRERQRECAIAFSGAHPGLLKAILWIVHKTPGFDLAAHDALARLCGHRDTEPECDKIWDSLDAEEQHALMRLAAGGAVEASLLRRLRRKGMLREARKDVWDVFSPVFGDYVDRKRGAPQPGARVEVALDPAAVLARIDGRMIRDLDPVAFQLLEQLVLQRGRAVHMRDLVDVVMRNRAARARFGGPVELVFEQCMGGLLAAVNRPSSVYILEEGDTYRFKDVM